MFACLNFIITVKTNLSPIKAGGSESLYSPWGGGGGGIPSMPWK